MQVIEQISPRHPEFRTLFLEIRGLFVERIITGTRRLQEEGLASTDIDVPATASMLGGMVEHTARMLFLYGEEHDPRWWWRPPPDCGRGESASPSRRRPAKNVQDRRARAARGSHRALPTTDEGDEVRRSRPNPLGHRTSVAPTPLPARPS